MSRSPLDWQAADFTADTERRADGSILLRPRAVLGAYPERLTDAVEYWARIAPERTMVARRDASGQWIHITYREGVARMRGLASGLLRFDLSPERPLVVLSGNSIEHLLLALAAMYVGVPYCPISPAYSQASSDLSKLRAVVELLTPGLVAAFGPGPYGRAIANTIPEPVALVGDQLVIPGRKVLSLDALAAGNPGEAAAAHAGTGPETIAKFLLTSGSTGSPKAVVTTHRMMCSNQAMQRHAMPFLLAGPPVLVDWLPWNHVFGGSNNVNIVLCNGGSLYIDDGRPTPTGFAETIRNLGEIAPTVYLNVPKGFDMLVGHLQRDAELRTKFYSQLRACFYAGAGLLQSTWDALEELAISARGSRIPTISGLGVTETAPSITFTTPEANRAGLIGLPGPGSTVKLAPVAGKLEMRVKGPNVMPGYWRQPELTAKAFDEEGYYRLGDAVRLVDPEDPGRGLLFDGRIAEDFKLGTGTWVSVGPLRSSLLAALSPLALDVVIAGLNQDYVSVLIFPELRACAALVGVAGTPDGAALIHDPHLMGEFTRRLHRHAEAYPASSTRVKRFVLLAEPPLLDRGEITDKGSINQRAVLEHRNQWVEDLYQSDPPAHVLPVC